MSIAIIGGTGLDEMAAFACGRAQVVSTRFGTVDVVECRIDGMHVLFVPRHGPGHSVVPGKINYRAQVAAVKKAGAQRVIGVCAVGSLTKELPCGTFAVLGDFIDLTKHRVDTFFDEPDGPVVHTDFTRPYCPQVSEVLVRTCREERAGFKQGAVYVGVEGPRYESPAEIRLYGSWGGDVIGMTNLPEVVLAREAGLCYGAIAVVTNMAAGLSPTLLSHDEVRAAMAQAGAKLRAILGRAISSMPAECDCDCRYNTGLVV